MFSHFDFERYIAYTTRISILTKWLFACDLVEIWTKTLLENELPGILRSTNHSIQEKSTPPNMYYWSNLKLGGSLN
jgi:hypothetical protein